MWLPDTADKVEDDLNESGGLFQLCIPMGNIL